MMIIDLTKQQLDFASKLIHEAFENSAKAFSLFINKKVSIGNIEVKPPHPFYETKKDDHTIIFSLLSELKGEIKGKCYLIFTESDANALFSLCLKDAALENENMQNAILLELDNILTAAVVTIISNKLKTQSYAYVPSITKTTHKELLQNINIDQKEDNLIFDFLARFQMNEVEIKSEFIWVLEPKFAEIIKNYSV